MSQSAISRIWRAFGLKPHLVDTCKLSNDPQFVDKVRDVVSLYLNPPEEASGAECRRREGVIRCVVLFQRKQLTPPCPSTGAGSWVLSCQRGGPNMKKTFITIMGALCIVAASATMAAAATTAPKSATRSTMASAVSASSGFPTICPPAAAVGKALGLTLSKPTVPMYTKGLALECKYEYTSKKGQTTLSYTSDTRTAFLASEKLPILRAPSSS